MSQTHVEGPRGLRLDIAVGTGFVVETGVYSIYTCLFIAAIPVLINARRRKDAYSRKSAWVFLIFSFLMYLVATLHLVLSAFRFYKSIFLNVDPNGPISYLQNFNHWEYLGVLSLLCIQTWLGDVLVIYRCYIVWNHNIWLILIPTCLLFGQIGFNLITLYWLRHLSKLSLTQAQRVRHAIYPLAFAQNFITTSLVILKILLQHRASKQAGIVDTGSKLGLIRIIRIIIESAAIYTIQIFVLVILSFRSDNFESVVLGAITPSIGITFVLLAVRIKVSRNEHTTRRQVDRRSSLFPRWAPRNDSETSSKDYRDGNSLPLGAGNEMIDNTIDAKIQSGTDSDWALESSVDSIEPPKVPSIPH